MRQKTNKIFAQPQPPPRQLVAEEAANSALQNYTKVLKLADILFYMLTSDEPSSNTPERATTNAQMVSEAADATINDMVIALKAIAEAAAVVDATAENVKKNILNASESLKIAEATHSAAKAAGEKALEYAKYAAGYAAAAAEAAVWLSTPEAEWKVLDKVTNSLIENRVERIDVWANGVEAAINKEWSKGKSSATENDMVTLAEAAGVAAKKAKDDAIKKAESIAQKFRDLMVNAYEKAHNEKMGFGEKGSGKIYENQVKLFRNMYLYEDSSAFAVNTPNLNAKSPKSSKSRKSRKTRKTRKNRKSRKSRK